MRVTLDRDPFVQPDPTHRWGFHPWPAKWVRCRDAGEPPFVTAYRCRFEADAAQTLRVHASADERYELFLDGERIGRGPERGDPRHWMYETYDLHLSAGEHLLVARVWSGGPRSHFAPSAQMTLQPGFLLAAEGGLAASLNTGRGAWEAKRIDGVRFLPPSPHNAAIFAGGFNEIDGAAYPWGVERGEGDGWQPAEAQNEAFSAGSPHGEFWQRHQLRPAMLPAMLDVPRRVATVRHAQTLTDAGDRAAPITAATHDARLAADWQAMLSGERPVRIAANSRQRVVVSLDDYYCFYPELVVSGGAGAVVEVRTAEALYTGPQYPAAGKEQRDRVEGLYFHGFGDRFLPGGGVKQAFEPLWWRCGRFVEFVVETGDEPLTIESWSIRETRYPLEPQTSFKCSDERWDAAARVMVRGLQMCAHETYMDCPYYEQLMYTGDTRLEVLTTYAVTGDDRLPRKAIAAYDWSRLETGLTQARYPSRDTQVIPPFALWWVAMVHDFALWRDDAAFVRRMMPGVRSVLEHYRAHLDDRGIVGLVPGWNFVDWTPQWRERNAGAPPNAQAGPSGVINWHAALTLILKADLESWFGDAILADRDRRAAASLAAAIDRVFWDESRGLYADDPDHQHFSEHAQCLALLSGLAPPAHRDAIARNLFSDPDLARTTIYFSHYLFEACRLTGRMDAYFDRLEHWLALPGQGFKTTPEEPEPSRSDCHAWGAHPLFHARATVLGIRPTAPGFRSVSIRPQLGPWSVAEGTVPHPKGEVFVSVRRDGDGLRGEVRVPEGVEGVVVVGDRSLRIAGGRCVIGD